MTTPPVSLALLVLLAVPGGARVAGCIQRPTTAATAASRTSYRTYPETTVMDSTYGEDIIVFCSARTAANLTVVNKDGQLPAKKYNSTTIQVLLQKLDVGAHTYYCTDSVSSCNDSLTVTVHPAVAVTASNIHHTLGRYGRLVYFVPRGGNYDVLCSANDVETLALEMFSSDEILQTKAANETTVMATVANVTEHRDYMCSKDEIYTFFKVIVDYKPEARQFSCILHLKRKLECSWISSSNRNTFSLSILRFNRKIPLCSDMSGALAAGCARAWHHVLDDLYEDLGENCSLLMEACNEVFCRDQTFEITPKSIVKVDPVYNMQLLNTTSRSAKIAWRHSSYRCYRNCEFKVKYRLGKHWRQEGAAVSCYDFSRDVSCEVLLPLPCPNAHYEVRVYVKPTSAADRCWSDPSSMLFFNTPGRFEEVGPACADSVVPEPTPTNAVLREVGELISDLNLHISQKMAEIKALLDGHV